MHTWKARARRRVARVVLPVIAVLLIIAAPAAGVYYAYRISGVMQTAGSDVGEECCGGVRSGRINSARES